MDLLKGLSLIARLGLMGWIILVNVALALPCPVFTVSPIIAWLNLTQYYATAFKTGQYPPIEKDAIFLWSRPHPASASAPDSVGPPANFELVRSLLFYSTWINRPITSHFTSLTVAGRDLGRSFCYRAVVRHTRLLAFVVANISSAGWCV